MSGHATPVADVSLVICAYTTERLGLLHGAVDAVRRQSVQPAERILVIDHNDVLEAYARLAWPDWRILAAEGTPGLSGARNAGVAAAGQPLVAFLDDDAEAEPTWLERLTGAFEDPSVMAAGGIAVPDWSDGRPAWFPPTFDWVVGCTHHGARTAPGPVRNVIGATMAFRREVLRAVGGFDPFVGRTADALLGAEETAVCIRIADLHGPHSVRLEPGARVRHHVSADRHRWGYFLRRCVGEGRSKARISAQLGSRTALSEERRHAMRVLPAAAIRGFAPVVRHEDNPRRSMAIAAGLVATSTGFAMERWSLGRRAPLVAEVAA